MSIAVAGHSPTALLDAPLFVPTESSIALERPGRGVPLADPIACVRPQVRVAIDAVRGPPHGDCDPLGPGAQAEVKPGFARGLITPPAEPVCDPTATSAGD